MDCALEYLHQLPAESNRIVQRWKDIGWLVRSAFDSQSLLELHQHYCLKRRCLACRVGAALIKPQ
jgi:hypothetical protein